MWVKKLTALLLFAAAFASVAIADQVTFSFIGMSSAQNLSASLAGFTAGTALNVLITDATTGVSLNLPGIFTTSTGKANSYTVLTTPNLVLASYGVGVADSVLITSPDGKTVYVAGINQDRGRFVSAYPGGTGAFLSDFTVTAVNPAVLAMFGLGPGFDPRGSVSITSGGGHLAGVDDLTATVGGGTVTIATTVPEPASLGLLGGGLLVLAAAGRKKFA